MCFLLMAVTIGKKVDADLFKLYSLRTVHLAINLVAISFKVFPTFHSKLCLVSSNQKKSFKVSYKTYSYVMVYLLSWGRS